jgi:tRNA (guanine-N7-)-methyltransferase
MQQSSRDPAINIEANGFRRPQINLTRNIRLPNYYTQALDGEFRDFAFNEERTPQNKGLWRSEIFKTDEDVPLDLEIGTGNGTHFQHHCITHPERKLVGIEVKYKPMIQSIRGCLRQGATNARICRYDAMTLDLMFAERELNDVYIHFPDPWVTPRKPNHRIVNPRILDLLWDMQRPGSFINFKTDNREYFLWAMNHIRQSKYEIIYETQNLHVEKNQYSENNFITQFERIFMRQGVEINLVRLRRA